MSGKQTGKAAQRRSAVSGNAGQICLHDRGGGRFILAFDTMDRSRAAEARQRLVPVEGRATAPVQGSAGKSPRGAARKAIADTIEEWVAFLSENDAEAAADFYYEISMLATAGNRRRIAKHATMPEGVFERVEDDLREQKEEAEREAAKAQAKDNGDDSNENVPA
ncbi:hypothetical protein EOK75_19430 (plasmid) [Pseudorhodobacter turbinis]|uniref:Uncharacterized protein n=1 Tax=Pseudorhodobacter turbinis TaxID=2500533 RepID=A0A4P8ELY6_9RHOB|nr:hypothetical protein [Pseudorhodobacter turbinis]QCO57835.1 hypothetical protein EOK75_19430 [Pseudorhodobacter turbinis]